MVINVIVLFSAGNFQYTHYHNITYWRHCC